MLLFVLATSPNAVIDDFMNPSKEKAFARFSKKQAIKSFWWMNTEPAVVVVNVVPTTILSEFVPNLSISLIRGLTIDVNDQRYFVMDCFSVATVIHYGTEM